MVRVASGFGEHNERAVGCDLLVLIAIARIEVLQRLILRNGMHGRADRASRARHGLLQCRCARSNGRQGLIEALELSARGCDVVAQELGVLGVVLQTVELPLHLLQALLLESMRVAQRRRVQSGNVISRSHGTLPLGAYATLSIWDFADQMLLPGDGPLKGKLPRRAALRADW